MPTIPRSEEMVGQRTVAGVSNPRPIFTFLFTLLIDNYICHSSLKQTKV
ncbi:hypothetical protein [Mucilaginibacter sp.]|nr:hypothetical protein [Mucilaginibacter sp.]